MASFFVYRNPSPASRQRYPYLLDLQHKLLTQLATRVVAPIIPFDTALVLGTLTPILLMQQQRYLILINQLTTIEQSRLKEAVHDASDLREQLIAAVDFLLTGV